MSLKSLLKAKEPAPPSIPAAEMIGNEPLFPQESPKEEVATSQPKQEESQSYSCQGSNRGYQLGNKILRKNKSGLFVPSNAEEAAFLQELCSAGLIQKFPPKE